MKPQHIEITTRRARKQYRCYECGFSIGINDSYVEHKGIWDDGWECYRLCVECDSLTQDYGSIVDVVLEGGWGTHGFMLRWVQDRGPGVEGISAAIARGDMLATNIEGLLDEMDQEE